MAKGSNMLKKLLMFAAIIGLIYLLLNSSSSGYSIQDRVYASLGGDDAPSSDSSPASEGVNMGCQMNAGTGLSSSLLPREVASQEDFGQFSPDDVLMGQNFLDPRMQIGFPETMGGTLRNANQQLRSDPPNPKDVFVWNNSTIVPDLMQRNLCT